MPDSHRKRPVVAATIAALVFASAAACSNDDRSTTSSPTTNTVDEAEVDPGSRQPTLDGTITVLASDSLLEALPLLVDRFQALNDGVEVTVRYGAALDLAVEIGDGIPADVFITDDAGSIAAVAATGRIDGVPKAITVSTEPTTTVTAATLSPSDNQMSSRAFIEFVSSSEGLDVLRRHDVGPPA